MTSEKLSPKLRQNDRSRRVCQQCGQEEVSPLLMEYLADQDDLVGFIRGYSGSDYQIKFFDNGNIKLIKQEVN